MGVVASGLCFCCSAASCACSAVSCCFSGAMGPNGVRASVAKFNYVVLLGLSTLLALIIRTYGGDIEAFGFRCGDELVEGIAVTCSGNAAVYRISFVMVLFFTLMFIGMVYVPTFTGDQRWGPMLGEGFHRGFWGPKIFIFVAALLASFFIPSDGFDDITYAWVARIVSILFLIVQVLVLIDFAYQWDSDWVERAYEGGDEVVNAGWRNAVVVCSFLLYAMSIGGFVILFTYYGDCPSGTPFSVITVVSVVLFTLITLFRDRIVGEDYVGSILPASVVSFYVTYLAWSALESSEDVLCRPLGGNNDGAVIALGSIFAIIALMWTSFTISKRAGNLLRGSDNEEDAGVGGLYTIEGAEGETTAREADAAESGKTAHAVPLNAETNDSELDTGDRAYIFHLIMITASMYMSMLLTNWGTRGIELVVEQNGTTDADIEKLFGASVGEMNMWVKIVAQWIAILLYIWTLIAPRVLENCREF